MGSGFGYPSSNHQWGWLYFIVLILLGNQTIILPVMGKYNQTGLFNPGMATGLRGGKLYVLSRLVVARLKSPVWPDI